MAEPVGDPGPAGPAVGLTALLASAAIAVGSLLVAGLALGGSAGATRPVWPDAIVAAALAAAAGLALAPGAARRGRLLLAGALAAAAVLAAIVLPPGEPVGAALWPGATATPGGAALAIARALVVMLAGAAASPGDAALAIGRSLVVLLAAAAALALLRAAGRAGARRTLAGWPVALAALLWLLLAAACTEPTFTRDQVLGGERVSAAELERGQELYERYCAICHGERGDGLGPSAALMWPPPRDFTTAQFKFAGAPDGSLAHDAELTRIVRGGLAGTAMQPWDLPDPELAAVLDYLKTFSPPGRGYRDPLRRPARPALPPDPTVGQDPAAVRAEGARLYHAVLQCNACHPSYATPAELEAWQAPGRPIDPLDPVPKWSATYRSVLLPPDFLRHPLRSIRTGEGPALEHDPGDLHRIIANGMSGPMPGYGHLDPAQVWAVVHYTRWLADQRGTAAGDALRRRLEEAWAR